MHFHGYVFANEPKPLMDSLIHFNGDPPAEVWLPLVVGDNTARSGWTKVEPEDWERELPSPYGVEDWVHCVWPTTFLRERLGPYALLSDEALDSAGVSHRNVKLLDGQWCAAVPRFFDTIGDHWSYLRSTEYAALVTFGGHRSNNLALWELDLDASLDVGAPSLIVGPDGPVFYDVSFRPEDPKAYRARVEAAAAPLLDLPRDTRVSVVDWHG